jgi:hypothetical protein
MNEHLRYLGQFLQHGVLNQMSNSVSFAYGEFSFNNNVQVNVEADGRGADRDSATDGTPFQERADSQIRGAAIISDTLQDGA